MAEITLKYAKGYEICCPLCGTPESQNPVRYPDAQNPGENWIKCRKCGIIHCQIWDGELVLAEYYEEEPEKER